MYCDWQASFMGRTYPKKKKWQHWQYAQFHCHLRTHDGNVVTNNVHGQYGRGMLVRSQNRRTPAPGRDLRDRKSHTDDGFETKSYNDNFERSSKHKNGVLRYPQSKPHVLTRNAYFRWKRLQNRRTPHRNPEPDIRTESRAGNQTQKKAFVKKSWNKKLQRPFWDKTKDKYGGIGIIERKIEI